MTPEDRKEKLKEEFAKVKELNQDRKIKSFSDLDIQIDKEVIEEWSNNR